MPILFVSHYNWMEVVLSTWLTSVSPFSRKNICSTFLYFSQSIFSHPFLSEYGFGYFVFTDNPWASVKSLHAQNFLWKCKISVNIDIFRGKQSPTKSLVKWSIYFKAAGNGVFFLCQSSIYYFGQKLGFGIILAGRMFWNIGVHLFLYE